jgi:hypothetical protein
MSERDRPLKAKAPRRGTRPRTESAPVARADVPRHVGAAGLLRLPGALLRAGNAAIAHWVSGQSRGRSLDPSTRGSMEAAFDTDFSHVRVHDDAQATATADSLGATAMTQNADIYVGSQAPALESPEGKKLLAHELAHVVQQDQSGGQRAGAVNHPSDAFEADAERAATAVEAGRPAPVAATGAPPAVQRQARSPLDDDAVRREAAAVVSQQTPVEIAVEAFLNREWDVQSRRQRPFRITASVRQGLEAVFSGTPFGIFAIASDLQNDPGTPDALLKRIRNKLPKTVDDKVFDVFDRLPPATASVPKTSEIPARPEEPSIAGDPFHLGARARQAPLPSKSEAEALMEALKEAVRRFRETQVGKELERSVRRFVLSKEGIPFDAIVAAGVVTFVAKENPELPSLPEITLGEGIKLKIEYKGRLSDLPPLVRQMLGEQGQVAPDAKETKVGLTLTVSDDKLLEFVRAVGRFFVVVGRGIGKGLIKVGTVIRDVVKATWPEIAAMAGGAALGGLIGSAFGPLGAGIGAFIGAGAGLIGALLSRLFRRQKGR